MVYVEETQELSGRGANGQSQNSFDNRMNKPKYKIDVKESTPRFKKRLNK